MLARSLASSALSVSSSAVRAALCLYVRVPNGFFQVVRRYASAASTAAFAGQKGANASAILLATTCY